MPHDRLDERDIRVRPLASRRNKHTLDEIRVEPDTPPPDAGTMGPALDHVIDRIVRARDNSCAVVLAFGAHLVKNGLGPLVARLVEEGWVTHLATNGAGLIHDWEYAFQGQSEEDVRSHVAAGCFGTWDETGRNTHLAALVGALNGMGYGESLGAFVHNDGCEIPDRKALAESLRQWAENMQDDAVAPARAELLQAMVRFDLPSGTMSVPHPHKQFSVAANAFRLGVPLTVHPGIGYDIVYNHPMANGAALGRAAGIDYGIFSASVEKIGESGVFLSVGSAVMAPQVFEKAVSFANNVRLQSQRPPLAPFIGINDIVEVDWNWEQGEPPADDPAYYVRFCKSFSRMGGQMQYLAGDNRVFLHNLHHRLNALG